MGDGGSAIIGCVCLLIGLVVAFLTVSVFTQQAKLFETLPAIATYLTGGIISITFLVFGGLLLLMGRN
jgi:hypothetical protein